MTNASTNHKTPQKLTLRPLTDGQYRAIELLLGGATDGEVAAAVGVRRETVWSWRRESPVFMATLERRHAEVWGSAGEKLRSLLMGASMNLAKAVEEGKLGASIEVLKAVGLYGNGTMNVIGGQDAQTCFEEVVANRLSAERIPNPMQALIDYEQIPLRERRRQEIEADLLRELEGTS
jgi:hypothetical protein